MNRSAVATLACGCRLTYRNFPEWRIPQVGDSGVWCYKHGDAQTVVAVEPLNDAPPPEQPLSDSRRAQGDGPGGKESEFIWSK